MKAIVKLCGKSIDIRKKQQEKFEKAQEPGNEAHVVYDEDEENEEEIELPDSESESDWDLSDDEQDGPGDLYDTHLDKLDEVIMVRDNMAELQK